MEDRRVTYSLQSMHVNQTLTALRDSDPDLYQLTHENLVQELAQIDSQIKDCVSQNSLLNVLQVRRWVVLGVIDHDFSRKILEEIEAKFIRIG